MLRYLWPPFDPTLTDVGRQGELLVARSRFILLTMTLGIPALSLLRNPKDLGSRIGFLAACALLAVAVMVLFLVSRSDLRRWISFATAILDVTIISFFHLMLFVGGAADMALGSRVTFSGYLLAILGTTLRYDGRIVTLAGLLAVAQWLGIVAWADANGLTARPVSAGLWYGDSNPAGQTEEMIIMLMTTGLASLIVNRSRTLRLQSIRDPLTHLANRQYFQERIGEELARSVRTNRPLSLAVIDLDHFKNINDTHGHQAGDAALRWFAHWLKEKTRHGDIISRIGGEEFAIILPETTVETAQEVLERLRVLVCENPMELSGGKTLSVTLTAGVAAAPKDAVDSVNLFAVADTRLFRGKSLGRNVVVASD